MRIRVLIGLLVGVAAVACAQSGASAPLPSDIDSQSYSRLPPVKRADLDPDGQRIYDMLAAPNKTVAPTGPAAISMYSPKVAESIQMLNQYLRFHGVLGRRDTEVAILVAARASGVDETVIDAIKYGKDVAGLSDKDALIIRFGRQLLRQHKLSSDLFAQAVAAFGKQGTFEMSAVMGDYAMAAIMLSAADQRTPPDRKELPLPPK